MNLAPGNLAAWKPFLTETVALRDASGYAETCRACAMCVNPVTEAAGAAVAQVPGEAWEVLIPKEGWRRPDPPALGCRVEAQGLTLHVQACIPFGGWAWRLTCTAKQRAAAP